MQKKRAMIKAMKTVQALLFAVLQVSMRSRSMSYLSKRHFKKLLVDLIKLIGVRLFVLNWSPCGFEACFDLPSY